MTNVWRSLEDMPGLVAVPAGWQRCLGEDFDAFRAAFLVSTGQQAESFPSPHVCECSLRVCRHRDGSMVAVSECGSTGCKDMPLAAAEVMLWEVSWKKLGRAVAQGFDCDAKDVELGVAGTRQIGSFGNAGLPVVLTIQHEEGQFGSVVRQLVGQLGAGFILLAPTSRFMNGNSRGLLEKAKARFFDLESHATVLPSGLIRCGRSGGALFAPLLPERGESFKDAHRVFRLFRELMCLGAHLKAPPGQVFELMVFQGQPQNETARLTGCARSLITKRVAMIESHFDMSIAKLRNYASVLVDMNRSVKGQRYARKKQRAPADDAEPADEADAQAAKEDGDGYLAEERQDYS